MTVIKRDKQATSADLISSIERFVVLLRDQGEHDACKDLEKAATALRAAKAGTPEHSEAVALIIEAFEGDHELNAYTHQRATTPGQWTEADELAIVSARVLNLTRRMK